MIKMRWDSFRIYMNINEIFDEMKEGKTGIKDLEIP